MASSRTIPWLAALLFGSATVVHAADVNGVWASDTEACNKVFTKKGGRVSFAKDADIHGSGFILDMMLSNMELTLKAIDDNKVVRVFAGMPELETLYYRCPQ